MNLLAYESFKKFDAATALSIIEASTSRTSSTAHKPLDSEALNSFFSPFDMKRLESYTSGMVDYHVTLDLVPTLALLFFGKRMTDCTLSPAQQAILLALGLQRKPVEALETELGLTSSQTLALFAKIIKRILGHLQDVRKAGVGRELPAGANGVHVNGTAEGVEVAIQPPKKPTFVAVQQTAEEELGEDVKRARVVQRELLDSVDMRQ